MTTPDLSGKRVLLLGAETDLGGEIARGLAEAGASLALIATSNDPQTAFAVQRLARELGASVAQAIDATNEMAVRVMVRQVSKALGGLDAAVYIADDPRNDTFEELCRYGGRELVRSADPGRVIAITPEWEGRDSLFFNVYAREMPKWHLHWWSAVNLGLDELIPEVAAALAGELD